MSVTQAHSGLFCEFPPGRVSSIRPTFRTGLLLVFGPESRAKLLDFDGAEARPQPSEYAKHRHLEGVRC